MEAGYVTLGADVLDAVRLAEGPRVEREEALDGLLRRMLAVEDRVPGERAHPGVRFDWKVILRAIEENLEVLPETYDYRSTRLRQLGQAT